MHDSRASGGPNPVVVIVPGFIHRALIRNKVTFSQYLDFEKIRSSLSSEDIKFWMAANEVISIGGIAVSQLFISSLSTRGRMPNEGDDFTAHGNPFYIPTKQDTEEVLAYLNQSNAMTENLYSLHREGSVLFVVVEEGFSLKLEENPYRLEFLKSYFKKKSEILPIHELAKDPLHAQYVSLVTT